MQIDIRPPEHARVDELAFAHWLADVQHRFIANNVNNVRLLPALSPIDQSLFLCVEVMKKGKPAKAAPLELVQRIQRIAYNEAA